MIRLFLVFAFSCAVLSISAQETNCNCLENLNKTIEKTEENYAGFPAKVNAGTSGKYKQLVALLKQKAANEKKAKNCYYVISEYVKFFKDKHFAFSYINDKDFDSTVVSYNKRFLEDGYAKKTLSSIEGIWTNPDSSVKIAIQKKANGSFQAIKITSKNDSFPVGFVYFTLIKNDNQYTVKEYNSFVSTSFPAKQNGNLLQIWNFSLWGKIYPERMSDSESLELSTWKNNNNGLAFRKLNAQFAYLKIPTFENNDNAIQQLITTNDSIIRNTKYLIVDLTGNGGGGSGWISFFPYLLTNSVYQEPSFIRVTPENIQLKLPDIEPYVNNPISDDMKKYFPKNILDNYKKAFAELPVTKEKFYPVPGAVIPLDSLLRFPQKVALMVDNFCGSTTEYFFYLTRQSKKTITYGHNTIGMMDYEGQSIPTPLPFNKFRLLIPIVRSSWTDKKPIDKTGFKPDVIINLPQNRWTDFIMKDLQKR